MGETWRARLLLLQIQQRRRTSSRYKFYFGRRAQGDNGEYCVLDFVQSVRMGALVKLGDQTFEKSEYVDMLLSAAAVACSFECPG